MMLSKYCRKKLGDFLKDKVDVKEGYTYEEQAVIEDSIRILIKAGIYPLDELRRYLKRMLGASSPGMDVRRSKQLVGD